MKALVTAAIIALATTGASAQSMNILQDKKRMVTEEEVKAQQELGEEPAWPIQYGYAIQRRNK